MSVVQWAVAWVALSVVQWAASWADSMVVPMVYETAVQRDAQKVA